MKHSTRPVLCAFSKLLKIIRETVHHLPRVDVLEFVSHRSDLIGKITPMLSIVNIAGCHGRPEL
jgi:hypothetical protein